MLDGDIEVQAEEGMETGTAVDLFDVKEDSNKKLPAWAADDVRRMRTALVRTQPTRRSCDVRLTLAD